MNQKLSILMVPVMALYIMLPCISQAETVKSPFLTKTQPVHSMQQSTIPPTRTIRYFYNGSTLMNAEDDSDNMSTYLSRTVRTIVNVNTKTVVDTQCLFTDGKNVISQTDSTGTTVTSTQQYNAFGQPVSYTSSTNKQINKLTNQQLNILTNPFQYDGYYYDSESGLYYLNARYYSPTLMQFISMDSYDLANRYAYCDGNPIGNEDPTGHNCVADVLGAVGLLTAALQIATLCVAGFLAKIAVGAVIDAVGNAGSIINQKLVSEDVIHESSTTDTLLSTILPLVTSLGPSMLTGKILYSAGSTSKLKALSDKTTLNLVKTNEMRTSYAAILKQNMHAWVRVADKNGIITDFHYNADSNNALNEDDRIIKQDGSYGFIVVRSKIYSNSHAIAAIKLTKDVGNDDATNFFNLTKDEPNIYDWNKNCRGASYNFFLDLAHKNLPPLIKPEGNNQLFENIEYQKSILLDNSNNKSNYAILEQNGSFIKNP